MLEKDDVIGDYKLERFLGRGQFGEVWLAEKQLTFSTRKFRHALKFLTNSGEEIDLKAAEAEIDTWIEASGHPNVMSVLDMIVHKNHIIIVSEFADGGSLKNWFTKEGKAPSHLKALDMMLGILHGLEHLHSRNVVHRDLKPDNILLQGNFPRITDFGVSRIVASGTLSTKPIGSPAYMSPESFNGNKAPQNDVWSAGVILYEMLTGTYPFEGDTIYHLMSNIQRGEVNPLPSDIPSEIKKIIEIALDKERERRFQTAGEMRSAVEKAIFQLNTKSNETLEIIHNLQTIEDSAPTVEVNVPNKTIRSEEIISDDVNVEKEKSPLTDIAELSQPLKTLKVKTNPEILRIAETQPSKIAETQDAEQFERMKLHEQETELAKIFNQTKSEREGKQPERKKRKFLVIGSAILGIMFLGLVGLIFVPNFLNSSTVSNVNTSITNLSNGLAKTAPQNPTPPSGMVYVSGGNFMMGRDDGKSDTEKPSHKTSVNPFFMDIYEVTNEQYAEFVKAASYKPPAEWKNGTFQNGQAKFPVVDINWEDANAYANWANKRLPTEEEWEFAARGTNNFLYPWGNDWRAENANAYGAKGFSEVGKFKGASSFGIYDMVGNAWEWTSSDFKAYPNGKLPDLFSKKTNLKTIRGGSFEATKEFATTTYRIGLAATGGESYSQTGFRCAKDLEK